MYSPLEIILVGTGEGNGSPSYALAHVDVCSSSSRSLQAGASIRLDRSPLNTPSETTIIVAP